MRKAHLSKRGVTATSYGLIVGLIAIIALAAITTIGSNVDSLFTDVSDSLQDVTEATAETETEATPTPTPLFTFSTHTFIPCGATLRNGPTLGECTGSYSTSWDEDPANFSMNVQGYQLFTVPATGTYTIEAAGAGNNGESYFGARLSADFDLTMGDVLAIAVGQQGSEFRSGSGGSFVALGSNVPTATALIVAGGAGGHYTTASNPERRNAVFTEDAYYSLDSTTPSNYSGPTGTGGLGGGGYHGGGGGGFEFDGSCNSCDGAEGGGFRSGLIGGQRGTTTTYQGGFGGGGSYHTGANGGGGGGGYSGGRGGHSSNYHGWGGGSYTAPSAVNRQDLAIDSANDGFVTITLN